MNRSITQKIFLVILLVTLMDGGSLAESGTRSDRPGIIQKSGPLINGMTSAMGVSVQPTLVKYCPGHRYLPRKDLPAFGGVPN